MTDYESWGRESKHAEQRPGRIYRIPESIDVEQTGFFDNPDLQSSAFPPSYDVATRTPPPYSAIDTQAQNDIDTIDTVEPAPQYNAEYAPLEDVGMAGFLRSELATIFEEDEDEAVE
ncbi:hypothetical protein IW261DRAFT_1571291 [Armillaria novae-zelandiae]|uniref:Uncharacterized protein n=1 Tax=Armillaria novae-zelandiae TaxID=153914 RepID=A0AA39NUD2_9AGAR|nr:hypothetical protein IW261DRAFT_1571291 [Armillaria novae-zelandiae]